MTQEDMQKVDEFNEQIKGARKVMVWAEAFECWITADKDALLNDVAGSYVELALANYYIDADRVLWVQE